VKKKYSSVSNIGVSIDISAINLPKKIKDTISLPFTRAIFNEWGEKRKLEVPN
jgi:hypothetical protein